MAFRATVPVFGHGVFCIYSEYRGNGKKPGETIREFFRNLFPIFLTYCSGEFANLFDEPVECFVEPSPRVLLEVQGSY